MAIGKKKTTSTIVKLHTAAQRGDGFACHQLGAIYATGDFGVAINLRKAANFYRLAANAGNLDGLYDLGIMYLHGQGVKKNKQKGLKLIKRAATMGLSEAQTLLGIIYETGHFGFRRNKATALKWYSIAAKKNGTLAKGYLRRLKREKAKKRGQEKREKGQLDPFSIEK